MESKVYLFMSKAASRFNDEYWMLLIEDRNGMCVAAIPISNRETVKRLKEQGFPVKVDA